METLRNSLRRLAQAEMQTDPAHDLAHLDRVWENARRIAADEPLCDTRALMAAAYLHDLVNLPKGAPDRAQASQLSARRAAGLLPSLGLSPDRIATTCHAIEAHSFSANITPETPEARILRDADRLDALGAVGMMRWFAVSGGLNRPLYDPSDPFAENRAPDDRAFTLDHWPLKLRDLADGMLTATGRSLARGRCALMHDTLAALAAETGATLPDSWRP
ncbi:MAG: HD domain-containing protein [Paracoccaceae bacterium]